MVDFVVGKMMNCFECFFRGDEIVSFYLFEDVNCFDINKGYKYGILVIVFCN